MPDQETLLNYHRNRYYNAAIGRWLSEDPIGFAAGDVNLNRFVGNAPTTQTDPDGLITRTAVVQPRALIRNNPLSFTMEWEFQLDQVYKKDVAVVGNIKVEFKKGLGKLADITYYELIQIVPATAKTNKVTQRDTWQFEGFIGGPLRNDATITMSGKATVHCAAEVGKEVLKWKPNQTFFGKNKPGPLFKGWSAGTLSASERFTNVKNGILEEEDVRHFLTVKFDSESGRTTHELNQQKPPETTSAK